MAKQTKTTKKTTGKGNTRTNRNTSTKAKTSAKKTANKQERPAYVPTEKDIKLRNEIKLLIALVVTVLVFLSNFGLLSPVGDYISHFLFGLFGFIFNIISSSILGSTIFKSLSILYSPYIKF